jgi:Putative RNA methylase family UPF0020
MREIYPENLWSSPLKDKLFPQSYLFVPNTSEIFEWELAFMEMARLTPGELIERSAFFSHIDGRPTIHYQLCSFNETSLHHDKSIAIQSFFKARQFSTGYATHGLFPYRDKLHPQLVKGIINVIGLKRGDVFLDPMSGSGTTCLEGRLLGLNSIGIDISPFCALMSEAKSIAMDIDPEVLNRLVPDKLKFLDFMAQSSAVKELSSVINKKLQKNRVVYSGLKADALPKLLMLIYLDTMGYARRHEAKNGERSFQASF